MNHMLSRYIATAGALLATAVLLSTALLPTANSWGQEPVERLIGRWLPDADKTKELLQERRVAEEEVTRLLEELESFELRFEPGNRFEVRTAKETPVRMRGSHAVVQRQELGFRLSLSVEQVEGLPPGTPLDELNHVIEVQFRGDDHLVIQPEGDERPAVFRRQRPEAEAQPNPLVGQWRGNPDRTRRALQDSGVDPDFIDDILERVSRIQVHFKRDGSYELTVRIGDETQQLAGTWRSLGELDEPRGLRIETIADEELGGETIRWQIHFLDDNTMKMFQADAPPVVYDRVRDPQGL